MSTEERLRRRDELLQVLFWLEGEGFRSQMTVAGVGRFIEWPEERIRLGLEELVADGLLIRAPFGEASGPEDDAGSHAYRLTADGRLDGGRRFVEEFAPILSRDTHYGGECHDPDCDCRTSPAGGAACQSHATPAET